MHGDQLVIMQKGNSANREEFYQEKERCLPKIYKDDNPDLFLNEQINNV